MEAIPPAADPAELLKAAKGRGPPTWRIAFGDTGPGRRGRKASGAEAEKPKATKPKPRKTAKRTARKANASKSAKAGR